MDYLTLFVILFFYLIGVPFLVYIIAYILQSYQS